MSRSPEEVGSKIEAILRKELAVSASIPWKVEGEERKATFGDALREVFIGRLKGVEYHLIFDLPAARTAQLRVGIMFAGAIGWLPGTLLYTCALTSAIPGSVHLEKSEPLIKAFGWSWPDRASFVGEPGICAKLNNRADIVACTSRLVSSKEQSGNVSLRISAAAYLSPTEKGSELLLYTLPKFGMARTKFHADDVLGLADKLEAAI